jgi:hypothetical protein
LLLRDRQALLICLGTVILIYLPFAVWDVAGLRNNLLFPFFRWTDSTALADSLSPAAQLALTIVGVLVVV